MECPFKDTWAKINDEIDTFPYRILGMDLVHNGQAEVSIPAPPIWEVP